MAKKEVAVDPAKVESQKLVKTAANMADSLEQDVEAFVIESQEDLEIMASELAKCKGLNNQLEEQKQRALGPMNEAVKEVRSWFKPIQDRLSSLERTIKEKVGDYHLEQEKAKRLALAEASKALRGGGSSAQIGQAMAKMAQSQVQQVDGMGIRFTWNIEIVDVDVLPDEWWTPDEGAIVRYVRLTKGEKPIPGVVFHKSPIVSSKAK